MLEERFMQLFVFCLLHMLRISVDVRIAGFSSQGIMGQNL